MWIDWLGRDLAGRELMASFEIDPEGGAPVQLVAKVGSDSKIVKLASTRRQANDGTIFFLAPAAGEQNPRVAVWLLMPDKEHPNTLKDLANVVPNTDPAFIPRIIKAILASISKADKPEEILGLYPALRSIERRAHVLRLSHAERWLPKEQSKQLIWQTYQNDPVMRASWTLAICESATTPPIIDADCWKRFTISDPDATAFLRKEVAALNALYAELEPTHPLRLRLKRLSDALSSGQ